MENKKEKNLYTMDLHEVICQTTFSEGTAKPDLSILRVPGGWIYLFWDRETQSYSNQIFVPFDNGFMNLFF